MNRTDRLYALVEELRAVAPRPRSARWLAGRFEVSLRTVERDISALQQSGTPIYAETGRTGGYCLDRAHTLPPVNLTPEEAVAMALALRSMEGTPFRHPAASALRKLLAAMRPEDVAEARDLAGRIQLTGDTVPAELPRLSGGALPVGCVLRIGYADRHGRVTSRDIEPLGYVGARGRWYLIAWCRLRESVRVFRPDRIASVIPTRETVRPRTLAEVDLDLPHRLRPLTLS
ncbi:helix-turn-helix transcriptional regulator [Actinoplanes derwentensis]|uniref:Predicted DNA-binding transcriptional regulator YafY, contains an HTH and WYL domains n=1 Tax=Actinoplanes derwentensis TaxID=113562 RepID=A0A1H2C447_9ACTN|nr:WYL domain-containing protein [Actinoplanes derwentensis]GID84182.1 transcriptional regulator [Actinoplanes derwentensis]SDT65370.1 Predicted DNA-binding transcriptional regulator YafY, contains an HTH and WYL domains [Actinoplanes derwentensis]